MPDLCEDAVKPIRTQSKDLVIQEAAKEGVKVWKIGGGYFTASAGQMAQECGVSETMIRNAVLIHQAGPEFEQRLYAGESQASVIWAIKGIAKPVSADSRIKCGNQQLRDDLAEAVAEIRRLREMLRDLAVDPDGS